MKKSRQMIDLSKERLSCLGEVQSRTQFGGYALAVEKVVFALVSDEQLYLRASEALKEYSAERPLQPLIFSKRGVPVSLGYFRVDEQLWQETATLEALSEAALLAAREEQHTPSAPRLKDLPNLGVRMEMMLYKVGICSVDNLYASGAKNSWLRLKSLNQHLGLKTLLALEGAISGHHQAALPEPVRAELKLWYQHIIHQQQERDYPRA